MTWRPPSKTFVAEAELPLATKLMPPLLMTLR
jgi:hypothetical protein